MKPLTQHQKILAVMCRGQKTWYKPTDFMDSSLGELFVGYEASARFSELARKYPTMMESRKSAKFVERRLRVEDKDYWLKTLPQDLRTTLNKEGVRLTPARPVPYNPGSGQY